MFKWAFVLKARRIFYFTEQTILTGGTSLDFDHEKND